MPTQLEEIIAATRRKIAAAKASADLHALDVAAENHQPRGFRRSLQLAAGRNIAVIAELKKASPSKGLIRTDFSVAELAREFETAGAAALSVLTEEQYFLGSLQKSADGIGSRPGCPACEKTLLSTSFSWWRRELMVLTRSCSSSLRSNHRS